MPAKKTYTRVKNTLALNQSHYNLPMNRFRIPTTSTSSTQPAAASPGPVWRVVARGFSQRLQRAWLVGGALSTVLLPLSWLYGLVLHVRRWLYAHGFKSRYHAPCPVIVVGNLFVGGTGKTPVVKALVQALQTQGWRPGILSRGYGVAIGKQARVADAQTACASLVGDEPALLAQYAPVGVHPKRALAAQALLSAHPDINVLVADDGLQHLALARDISLVVQDDRGIGNGRLLPAGPLRDLPNTLAQVDWIITNDNHRPLANTRASCNTSLVTMQLVPTHLIQLSSQRRLTIEAWQQQFQNTNIIAVAGIGNPQRFFETLRALGITAASYHGFNDHHPFEAVDFERLSAGSAETTDNKTTGAELFLMTEKDAMKCRDFADERFWYLVVDATFEPADFLMAVDQRLRTLTADVVKTRP